MKRPFLSLFIPNVIRYKYLFLLVLSLLLNVGAIPAIASTLPSVRLLGHVPTTALESSVFLGNLDEATHVPVTFILPLRNQEALEELVQRIHDPSDREHYGKYLTSEQFVEQFAPSQEDYHKVIAYAKTLGFTVSNTHSNRTLLTVSGPAGSMETAFNLQLHTYQTASGRKFYAPNNNPEVPTSIASVISGVVGLDNHAVWRPFRQQKQVVEKLASSNTASHTFPSGPGGGYSPSDILTAYNLAGVPADGSGQSIALFELAGYQVSDINAYTSQFG